MVKKVSAVRYNNNNNNNNNSRNNNKQIIIFDLTLPRGLGGKKG